VSVKVLLVQPPIEDFYDTSIRTYPLGLAYLAGSVSGLCDVSVADLRTGTKRVVKQPPVFDELHAFYRDDGHTPFSLFSRFYRFGASPAEIRRVIERKAPDIVAIASAYTTYSLQALEVARIAKDVSAEIVTVMGGTHATLFPKHLLQHSHVDYVIRGEGETPFAALVEGLSAGRDPRSDTIDGLCFRQNGELHIGAINIEHNIDTLPDRRPISADAYRINRKKYTFFLISRGCPFSCTFCGKPPVPYRKRSLAAIERELAECVGLGIEAIDFEDDMLNLDKSFFTDVLRLFSHKGLTLSAMNGIYPATIDVPTLQLMHEAGFRRLNFSLVDAQEPVLRSQGRILPNAFLDLLPWLESSPFLVETHFIIGLPGQKPQDVIETLVFLMGTRLLLGPSMFYLAPGSATFGAMFSDMFGPMPSDTQMLNDRDVPQIEMLRSSVMFPWNPLFSRKTTYTLMKLVRFINWVKQTLDRTEGLARLSDLLEVTTTRNPHEQGIVSRLLTDKRFTRYAMREQRFIEETHEPDLVRIFFERARGVGIKGFKTSNELMVDV
jgi:anaerobic magnesium-protoporphyrin IX monomethyl ester cyclase